MHHRHSRPARRFRSIAAFLPLAAVLTLPAAASPQSGPGDVDGMRASLDASYVAGPTLAKELGARLSWQSRVPLPPRGSLQAVETVGDAILAIDTSNQICRLRPEDGTVIWNSAVGNPIDRFLGIFGVDVEAAAGKLYAVFSTELYVLDASNGSIVGRQPLAKLPVTRPLVVGPVFVYGTAAGHIVAHHCLVGHEFRTSSLDSRITGAPLPVGDRFIVASGNGEVACLNSKGINRHWNRRLFAGIQAAPAVAEGTAFIAGLDQYLWAFDVRSGNPLWRRFFTSPLVEAPIAEGDAIMQRVPDVGVVCFTARPEGKPDGEIRWTAPAVTGDHVGSIDGSVAFWNAESHELSLIEPKRGSVRTVTIPQASGIFDVTSGPLEGSLLAYSADGRIVRLEPREAKTAAAASSPSP
jgi:outer membrane protein assembly factor BamB